MASRPAELAPPAREAIGLLPGLRDGLLAARGRHLRRRQRRRPRHAAAVRRALPGERTESRSAEAVQCALAALRWLDALEAGATAAVGHGLGDLVGLAWAGVLSEADVTEVAALRAEFLSGPAVRLLPVPPGAARCPPPRTTATGRSGCCGPRWPSSASGRPGGG